VQKALNWLSACRTSCARCSKRSWTKRIYSWRALLSVT